MGSIPLAALAVQPPPQPPNLLDQATRTMQLRDLMQNQPLRNQMMQQEVQQGQLDNQIKQTQVNDTAAMSKAMQSWDGKNLNDLVPLVVKNGGSANAVMGLKQKILDQQQTYSKIAADDATTGSKNLETQKNKNDMIAGRLQTVLTLPDEQLGQGITSAAQDLIQQGMLDPQHAQAAESLAGLPAAQARSQLDLMRKGLLSASQLMEEASRTASTKASNAETEQKNAQTLFYQQHGGAPGVPVEAQQQADWLAKPENRGKGPADYEIAMKKLVPAYQFNLQNSGVGPGPGGQPSVLAQKVASGDMKWSEVIGPRTPQSVKDQFAKEVNSINPSFSTSTYSIETKAAEKATSGTWADTRVAYNTALDHSDLLLQAAAALKNGDVKALNSLKNRFGSEFGWSGPITYDAIANAYNHEVTSVISKGHLTDSEVQTGHATLPSNANLDSIQGVVGAYKALMTSKRAELDKIIKAGAGNKADSVLNVGSDSGQGGGGKSGAGSGGKDPFAQFGGTAHSTGTP